MRSLLLDKKQTAKDMGRSAWKNELLPSDEAWATACIAISSFLSLYDYSKITTRNQFGYNLGHE
jgi:hypothetical protein